MKQLFTCRRTYIATLSILCLTGLGIYLSSTVVAAPISAIAIGLSASNAYQKKGNK